MADEPKHTQANFIKTTDRFCGVVANEAVDGGKVLTATFISDNLAGGTRGIPLNMLDGLIKAGDKHTDILRALSELRTAHAAVAKDPNAINLYLKEPLAEIFHGSSTIKEACPAYEGANPGMNKLTAPPPSSSSQIIVKSRRKTPALNN